jgi:hypothetical protein
LLRTDDAQLLHAYHGSPGTDTRVATLDLTALAPAERVDLWVVWSPDTFRLHAFDPANPGGGLAADGVLAEQRLWVARDGSIVEVGCPGITTMGATVYASGRELVAPPAVEAWREVLEAAGVLVGGESPGGYLYEVVTSNAALTILITGFETYCDRRFVELDREGVPANLARLIKRFGTLEQRQALGAAQLPTWADALDLVRERINFQNFDDTRRAFNRAYSLSFGRDLGVGSEVLERTRRLLRYRHRIVHVSPLLGMLNGPEVPPEEPEFSNFEFVNSAVSTLDEFIGALHRATPRLRRSDAVTQAR